MISMNDAPPIRPFLACLLALPMVLGASEPFPGFDDPEPGRHRFEARASEVDPRATEHPELDFVFEKDGKPADLQHASVDTRVEARGRLVIWLMGYNDALFERLNGYGLHAIQVHYARGWFRRFGSDSPGDDGQLLGNIRLEAATGEDHSPLVDIPRADGMSERARQWVKWLAREHPEGRWDYFLGEDGKELRWDCVIVSGSSHGATTSARFAKHQAVDRVVMFCGPRDQDESWQALPSATDPRRYFGFSHVLDGGWTGNHYPRSWKMMGLEPLGPLVDVDEVDAPYQNSRRLVTAADVGGSAKRAHGSVVPGKSAVKDGDGHFLHEDAWRYLYTHPVDEIGETSVEPEGR